MSATTVQILISSSCCVLFDICFYNQSQHITLMNA